jgi:hypothetical protein
VDHKHVLTLVETIHGAYLNAVHGFAANAALIDDVGQSCVLSADRSGELSSRRSHSVAFSRHALSCFLRYDYAFQHNESAAPAFPAVRSKHARRMSLIGTKRTFQRTQLMSALGGKADIMKPPRMSASDPKRT